MISVFSLGSVGAGGAGPCPGHGFPASSPASPSHLLIFVILLQVLHFYRSVCHLSQFGSPKGSGSPQFATTKFNHLPRWIQFCQSMWQARPAGTFSPTLAYTSCL